MTETIVKRRQGFASMDPEKHREVSSKGGHSAQQKGKAHRWTKEAAQSAGRKGGRAGRRRQYDQNDRYGTSVEAYIELDADRPLGNGNLTRLGEVSTSTRCEYS